MANLHEWRSTVMQSNYIFTIVHSTSVLSNGAAETKRSNVSPNPCWSHFTPVKFRLHVLHLSPSLCVKPSSLFELSQRGREGINAEKCSIWWWIRSLPHVDCGVIQLLSGYFWTRSHSSFHHDLITDINRRTLSKESLIALFFSRTCIRKANKQTPHYPVFSFI